MIPIEVLFEEREAILWPNWNRPNDVVGNWPNIIRSISIEEDVMSIFLTERWVSQTDFDRILNRIICRYLLKIEPGLLNNGVFIRRYQINKKTNLPYIVCIFWVKFYLSFFPFFLVLHLCIIFFVILEWIFDWIVGEILLISPSTNSIEQFWNCLSSQMYFCFRFQCCLLMGKWATCSS
jgi:hypothetical protein